MDYTSWTYSSVLHTHLYYAACQPGDVDRKPGDVDRQPGDVDRQPGDEDVQPGEEHRQADDAPRVPTLIISSSPGNKRRLFLYICFSQSFAVR